MQKGKVKFYSSEKRFGFIIPENGGVEIFFHASGLNGDVKKDDIVEYDTEEGKKGLQAVNVSVAG